VTYKKKYPKIVSTNIVTKYKRMNNREYIFIHLYNRYLPISICIHECELESDQAVEIGVVVPGGFVQEEDVPVCGDEHEARQPVEKTQHDPNRTLQREANESHVIIQDVQTQKETSTTRND
jgi:hypothetical protein